MWNNLGYVNEEGMFVTPDNFSLKLPSMQLECIKEKEFIGKDLVLGIRPEELYSDSIHLNNKENVLDVDVDFSELLGATTNVHFKINDCRITASIAGAIDCHLGDIFKVYFDLAKCHLFDPETTSCLTKI